ncbi:MAG: hypothetical protein Q4A07_13400 [Coriobacteriales bacterium]|nr:hypothetical protein [Coriobacteriales bacterium]
MQAPIITLDEEIEASWSTALPTASWADAGARPSQPSSATTLSAP